MIEPLEAARLALLGWASAVAGTSLWAVLRPRIPRDARGFHGLTSSAGAHDVVLIRPCAGREPHLGLTLMSTGSLRDAEGIRIVFAVPSERDPAFPVALGAARALAARGLDASCEVTTRAGPNNKAAQLAVAVSRDPTDCPFVLVVDSDVDLAGVSIAELMAPLRDRPEVAAVWAPPVEVPLEPTLGDRLSAAVLGGSLHAFHVLARLDRSGMVGKCFAVRRGSLARMGGFASLRDVLGEDVELAQRLRAVGGEVVSSRVLVRSRAAGRSVGAVAARFGRWLTVVRGQRPALLASYPLLFAATTPILLACLALGPSMLTVCAVSLAMCARWLVAVVASREAALPAPSVPMMVASDVVLLVALVRALSTRRVRWRDRELVLTPRGALVEADPGRRLRA